MPLTFYMPILFYAVYSSCFLVLFTQIQYAAIACCYSRWVFKVRFIINGCWFSCLSYCLAYAFVVVLAKSKVLFYVNVFCSSRAEVVLRQCFVTWLCRACVRTRGLISLKFSHPGLVYAVFCGSRAEVVLLKVLLPDSVERVLEPAA